MEERPVGIEGEQLGVVMWGGKALKKALDGMMEGIYGHVLVDGMHTLVEQVREIVAEHAPYHSGDLVDDIHAEVVETSKTVSGDVFSTLYYAPYQEFGWESGIFPNVSNLSGWCEEHGIDPWALAIYFFEEGYEGHHMYRIAFEALEQWADSADVAGFDSLLGKLIGKVWSERHEIHVEATGRM